MTPHHLYAAGFLGGIVAVCAFLYVLWLDGQLKDARDEVKKTKALLAKSLEEQDKLRELYLRASGAAWRTRQ